MYFHGKIESVFSCLDEETIKQIADTVNSCGRAMLYYNTVIETFNVADPATINDPKEILVIAVFTQKDFEFTDTNREIINTMSNETLAAFMVDKVLNDKKSICDYLSERSEESTYNLAKIGAVKIEGGRLRIYTSIISCGIVEIGDVILIAPIEGVKYQAIVKEIVRSAGNPAKVGLILEFEDSNNVPISIIQKLDGVGIKLAPKNINADPNTNNIIESPAKGGVNVLGEGMIERRKNGGIIII